MNNLIHMHFSFSFQKKKKKKDINFWSFFENRKSFKLRSLTGFNKIRSSTQLDLTCLNLKQMCIPIFLFSFLSSRIDV